MTREATKADIQKIVDMGARFIGETGYKTQIPQNPVKMRCLVEQLIDAENGLLLVHERNGAVDGMIGVMAFEHPMSGEMVASEMFWWVEPEARGSGVKLLRLAEAWAHTRGATKMMMIAPTDKVGEFYERVGYERVETTYQRRM